MCLNQCRNLITADRFNMEIKKPEMQDLMMQMLQFFNSQATTSKPVPSTRKKLVPESRETSEGTSEYPPEDDTSNETIDQPKRLKKTTKKSLIPTQLNKFNGDLHTVCMLDGTTTYGDFLLRC